MFHEKKRGGYRRFPLICVESTLPFQSHSQKGEKWQFEGELQQSFGGFKSSCRLGEEDGGTKGLEMKMNE